jgi:hypothetical protein
MSRIKSASAFTWLPASEGRFDVTSFSQPLRPTKKIGTNKHIIYDFDFTGPPPLILLCRAA